MKLALVVQRYGEEVAGGSEAHCRDLACRLAENHEVTVLTTCAKDYLHWRNVFPSGESVIDGVRVVRFKVSRRRRMARFNDLSDLVFGGDPTEREERTWFAENGPYAPQLIQHIVDHKTSYDRFLFWTYRYYPSFFGLPEVAERAILLPTAEADPAIRMAVLDDFFALPRGFLFLTEEEAELVSTHASRLSPNYRIIGSGLDPADRVEPSESLQRLGISDPFALYLGRIDENKGCKELFENFERYLTENDTDIDLVLAGAANMIIPKNPKIRHLGFVDPPTRDTLLAGARVLIMPSPYESLSLVLLEAWNHSLPALVNGRCTVLRGQTLRANGGLFYRTYEEFAVALQLLIDRPEMARTLGRQGRTYVDQEYRWPVVLGKVEEVLAGVTDDTVASQGHHSYHRSRTNS